MRTLLHLFLFDDYLVKNLNDIHSFEWCQIELLNWIRTLCYQSSKRNRHSDVSFPFASSWKSSLFPYSKCKFVQTRRHENHEHKVEPLQPTFFKVREGCRPLTYPTIVRDSRPISRRGNERKGGRKEKMVCHGHRVEENRGGKPRGEIRVSKVSTNPRDPSSRPARTWRQGEYTSVRNTCHRARALL